MSKHWSTAFAGRELSEIEFARFYHQRFGHGTPGHAHLMIISQLSRLVDELCNINPDLTETPDVANKPTA
jgi:hypothetical protein